MYCDKVISLAVETTQQAADEEVFFTQKSYQALPRDLHRPA